MITSMQQAIKVQMRRRERGMKGRAKAVRRFIQREYNVPSIDVMSSKITPQQRYALEGIFEGCRSWEETHGNERAQRR
jgi:hypothetical protein